MSNVVSFGTGQPVTELPREPEEALARSAQKFADAAAEIHKAILEGRLRCVVLLARDHDDDASIHNFLDPDPIALIGLLEYQKHMVLQAIAGVTEQIVEGDES